MYNKKLLIVEESVHVTFDETYPTNVGKDISFHDAGVFLEDILKDTEKRIGHPKVVKPQKEEDDNSEKEKDVSPTKVSDLPLICRSSKNNLIDNILGDITKGVTTHSKLSNLCYHFAFIPQVEPKNAKEALIGEH